MLVYRGLLEHLPTGVSLASLMSQLPTISIEEKNTGIGGHQSSLETDELLSFIVW